LLVIGGETDSPNGYVLIPPDEKFIAALDRELRIFNYFIERDGDDPHDE